MNCDEPEFWEIRYRAGRMPWDLKGVPEALQDYLQRCGRSGRALIPGCGLGYEVRAFVEAGWDVLAVDFSPAAVERACRELGPLSQHVRCADFFADDPGGPFDLVYERTFLCSLPPSRWPEYVSRMAKNLRPGGVLAGVFYYGHDPEPPPFGLTSTSAQALLGGLFALNEDVPIPAKQSLPVYGGHERWQVWRRALSAPN